MMPVEKSAGINMLISTVLRLCGPVRLILVLIEPEQVQLCFFADGFARDAYPRRKRRTLRVT